MPDSMYMQDGLYMPHDIDSLWQVSHVFSVSSSAGKSSGLKIMLVAGRHFEHTP